ncbi:MAG: enoyl-CoA hydratase/isomerase family protein [Spirulina sp. SIO3F2]|nr:enoyl-CoA hydratase/isomerase family protein [Spirulina sp. SIO3F2]
MELTTSVRYQLNSGVAEVVLAAPETGNSFTPELVEQLRGAIAQANANADCRVIVLSAEGDDFCRGLDLAALVGDGDSFNEPLLDQIIDCLTAIYRSPKPVIACVDGSVTGGGLGLVAACDIVLATSNAVFMLSEVIVGMIPAMIAPFLLRRLSPAQLQYLTLSSCSIDATEAKDLGLVDNHCEDLAKALKAQLKRLFRSSPRAIAQSKMYFEQLSPNTLNDQLTIAKQTLVSWLQNSENLHGIQQFSEGLSPTWFARYPQRRA